jgi:HPr kinase/phosphorylase
MELIHATTVSVDGRALMIMGPAGRGKSALGLQMIALGAQLVADDQTALNDLDGVLMAAAAPNISGVIEARGIGLLRANSVAQAQVIAVVDLDQTPPAGACAPTRLPDPSYTEFLGLKCRALPAVAAAYAPAAYLQFLKCGIADDI